MVVKHIVVLALMVGLVPAITAAKAMPADGKAAPVRSVCLGPSSPAPVDPELGALKAELDGALNRGDQAQAREADNRIQALLLTRQPRPTSPVAPPKVSYAPPSGLPAPGPDVMIQGGTILATAADYQADGTMWTVCSRNDSSGFVFKSTDHGQTWQFTISFNWGFNITRLGMVAGEGDSDFVHVFVIHPANDGDLYDVRCNRDGSGVKTFPILTGPDTISDFSVCRDMNTSSYSIYVVGNNGVRTAPPLPNCRVARSLDFGKSWAVTDSFWNVMQPHLSIGAGSYLYFVMRPTPSFYPGYTARLVNTNYGSPGYWNEVDVHPDTFQVSDPVIGAAFTLPESLAVIWTMYSHNYSNSGDWDILFDCSTDGGASWSVTDALAYSGNLEVWPDIRNYASLGNDYMNASYMSIDSSDYRIIYRHYVQAGTPTSWSDTLRINSGSAGTGRDVRPLLLYSPGTPGTGSGCVFTGEGLQNLYWNSPWYPPSVAETRGEITGRTAPCVATIVRGVLRLADGSSASSSPSWLLDACGRNVMELLPGANDISLLAPGVYFVRAESGELSAVGRHKIVLAR
jgi:hypothetical protein